MELTIKNCKISFFFLIFLTIFFLLKKKKKKFFSGIVMEPALKQTLFLTLVFKLLIQALSYPTKFLFNSKKKKNYEN